MRGLTQMCAAATTSHVQLMVSGAPGFHGAHAARAVGKAPRRGCGSAAAPLPHMAGPTAAGLMCRGRSAARGAAQWTGSGPHGAAGAPALCPVGEAAVRGHANAQTQPHSLEVTDVKETTYKLIFATAILVPFMAAGALGAAGERAVVHAMVGR